MLTREELEKSPLFQDISYESYLLMLDCFHATQKSFRPDELIYDFTAPKNDVVGVLERGEAAIIRIDEEGVATVLEELTAGGVFGRNLAFAGTSGDSLEVVCRAPCDVVFIDYPHILKRCERACTHHSLLVQNMLRLISDKAQSLSERVDVLSRRSIREKLLCYFRQLAARSGSSTFTLPFSLSILADYIATDRSAMMRELKRLREEGILSSENRSITLRE
ncbi:MAG: Crp/Fnr family transcriptional regulator [Oscillibacter sp.]